MAYVRSGDEQSEDGELRHSPSDIKKEDILDFSLSDEDPDTADSLDIKPPQASRLMHSSNSSKSKRRDREREGRSRHGKSDRHRDQERHSHRDKHHRDRSGRDREQKYEREYREKEHFRERDIYREKEIYVSKGEYSKDNFRETREIRYSEPSTSYKEVKYTESQYRGENRRDELKYGHESSSREMRYIESRKYDEKRNKDSDRYADKNRYLQEQEKNRRYEENPERRMKSAADQTLDDLRERLLDKRRIKESTDDYRQYEKESRRKAREREVEAEIPHPHMETAETYVKEIIDLSVPEEPRERRPEKVHRREEREEKQVEWEPQEKKLTDAEREEQQMRRERLLEAEREMERQKEQYRLDKERRHRRRQERQEAKRRLQLEREEQQQAEEEQQRKRQRMSGELGQYKDKDLSIVTVSDNSSNESTEEEDTEIRKSEKRQHTIHGSDSEGEHSGEEEAETGAETSSRDGSETDEEALEEPRGRRAHIHASDSELEHSEERKADTGGETSSHEGSDSEGEHRARRRKTSADSDDEHRDVHKTDSSSISGSRSPSPKSNGQMQQKSETEGTEKPKTETQEAAKIDTNLCPYLPAIQGCRSVEEFQCLNRIEEGTYGVVYRARDKRTEEIVALKRLKMEKEKEGFPITSLREINTLLKGQHPNIVTVREIVVGSNMDKIFIVMDYVEHDLKSLMETMRNRRQAFVPGEVKCLLKQLLGAVQHLHDNWILHRDLKTSNLLLSHKGILKVGDFGLAREYGSPLKAYTPIVVTLWYRAPELLLCCKEYSTPVDMWSVGCIFAELLLMNALFPGKSEVDQLNRIFKDLGTPNDKIWPGYSELPAVKKMKFTEYPVSQLRTRFPMVTELGSGLLQKLLTYDPVQRVSAEEALKHPYFNEQPLPVDPAMFPTWPAKSELGHRKVLAAAQSPKPPSGGREYKQLGDGDEDSALGFHMGGASSSSSHLEARRLASGAGFSLKF